MVSRQQTQSYTLDHQAQLTSVASRESVDETTNNHEEAANNRCRAYVPIDR